MAALKTYAANLHIHTALSPCASNEMTPQAIVKEAFRLGLQLIAVTDHNTAENVAAVTRAAYGYPLRVLAGMEIQTREDVHLVCLFDSLDVVLDWQEVVYRHLPDKLNDERFFGEQLILDQNDQVIGCLDRLLLTSINLGVTEAVSMVKQRGGLCIPAHVDRPSFSLIGHLGFIPPELGLQVAEISPRTTPRMAVEKFKSLKNYTLMVSSDAHYLSDLGNGRTVFHMRDATLEEMQSAFQGLDGRKLVVPA